MNNQSHIIRAQNDRFRRGDKSIPGEVVITTGINALIGEDVKAALELRQIIRSYSSFSKDNDPWGEHEFGAFDFKGEACFWKIDIYDAKFEIAPLDPADLESSKRVLTIMMAGEY